MPSSSASSTTARRPNQPPARPEQPAAEGSEQPAVRMQEQPAARQPNWMTIMDDQRFLMLFIMGTYFGPDVANEKPHKSVFQRLAEGRRQYQAYELAGSRMMISKLESVYYYVVRMAERTVVVQLPLLRQFFLACLFTPADFVSDLRQFPDLFPPHLHNYIRIGVLQDVIENIVFISNPNMSYVKPENFERFKRLTNREFLFLDGDAALSFCCDRIHRIPDNVAEHVNILDVPETSLQESRRRQAQYEIESGEAVPMPLFYYVAPPGVVLHGNTPYDSGPVSCYEPMPYALNAMADPAFRGSIAGPLMGCFDVRICEDCYSFHAVLPIRRNSRNRLTFVVHDDGEITIKGEAMIGSRMVADERRPIETHPYYLCIPGEFSVSFYLPGPIDPTRFTGIVRPDGIFEGRVKKRAQR